MSQMLDIYVGFDSKEVVAYHVLCQSILDLSSIPVRFTPLNLNNMKAIFGRERHPLQSTEFSFSRFLVPYLSSYSGWSLFMDCDMISRVDLAELIEHCDNEKAVMVCKHDYVPKEDTKFLGQVQTKFEKKNWSSVMLFNNELCRALTPNYVERASGLELHQFKWLDHESQIGSLPLEWNWLVGDYDYNPDAKIVHFTSGGPYFDDYTGCDYSDEWRQKHSDANKVLQKP